MSIMRSGRGNISHRRAVSIVWLVLCNMALSGVYIAVGESVAHTSPPATRAPADLLPLAAAFVAWSLVAMAWRRSVALGSAVQIALPALALGFLWFADRDRLLRLADTIPAAVLVTAACGLIVTFIMFLQSRRQPPAV
jgi:hypothetical protein